MLFYMFLFHVFCCFMCFIVSFQGFDLRHLGLVANDFFCYYLEMYTSFGDQHQGSITGLGWDPMGQYLASQVSFFFHFICSCLIFLSFSGMNGFDSLLS